MLGQQIEELGEFMKDKLSKISKSAKSSVKSATDALSKAVDAVVKTTKTITVSALDQDGDGDFDQDDIKILTEKGIKAGKAVANKSTDIIKDAIKSTLAKDVAAGAAVGAAVAIPVPIIGPVAGSVIGAGLGAYKNITGKGTPNHPPQIKQEIEKDTYSEILKLGDLKDKGLITEKEFEEQKNYYSVKTQSKRPNKSLQLTQQYAVSLRYTPHCRSTEFKRYAAVTPWNWI